MCKKLVIGFLVTLAALILIAVLSSPLGAVLGCLVFLSVVATVVHRCLVSVQPREALIVQSALHGAVYRVVCGPKSTVLLPFLEEAGPVLDTGDRRETMCVRDVLQRGQRPTPFIFEAHIMYRLAPQILSPSQLGEILPSLTDNLNSLLRFWTDCYLRKLVADIDLLHSRSGDFNRLECRLDRLMADQLAQFGIVIQDVQLLIQVPAEIHDTLTVAEQERVGTTVQAERLGAILGTLRGQSEEARSLALLELVNAWGRKGQVWTSFDLASLMNPDDAASDQPLLSPRDQLP